jgi:starvation-inducible DNA-binding protein
MATKTKTQNDAKARVRMIRTKNDLPEDTRQQMVALLNQQLADTFDLFTQTKQAHWNVKGIHFEQLHVLFDKMAGSIFPYVDMIAERATALGGTALGTVRMAAGTSELPEFPKDAFEGDTMLKIVVERWAQYANGIRAAVREFDEAGDLETSDMFTEVGRVADKMLWFAEAHLQA